MTITLQLQLNTILLGRHVFYKRSPDADFWVVGVVGRYEETPNNTPPRITIRSATGSIDNAYVSLDGTSEKQVSVDEFRGITSLLTG